MRISSKLPLRAGIAGILVGFGWQQAHTQAVDLAPLLTPPVQRVAPPTIPEVVPPSTPTPTPLEQVPAGPPIHIDDVRIEGVSVYKGDALRPFYADMVNATVPRERLLQAVETLQTKYREDGYLLTTVHGEAEHDGDRLIFVIRANEGYIDDVQLEGDIGPSSGLALAILKHLTWIRPVRNADLERYLLLVNDIPGITAQGVLRRVSPQPGAVQLVAQVQRKPFSASFQFDNRGSNEVGPYEALITGQSNSFTRMGEQIEAIFFNTFNREQLFGQVDASGFLNSEGLRGRAYFGRGNIQPGGVLTGTGFSGDITIGGVGLSYPVIRTRRLNLIVDSSFDLYDSTTDTTAAGGLAGQSHLRILRGGGSLDFQDSYLLDLPAANSVTLRVSHGVRGFGASALSEPMPTRIGMRPDFTKITGELTRVQNLFKLDDVQTALKTSVGGQFTDDVLPPSEQFLLGGTRFGRGFYSGQISGDRALGATIELQFNTGWENLSPIAPGQRLDVQFYTFFDYGRSYNLGPTDIDHTVDSVGLGARSDVTPWLFVELEGVRRLTTRPTGIAVAKLDDYAVFSRVVVRY